MTEVAFHFNVPDKLGYACRLLRKAYAAGGPVGVVAPADTLDALNTQLWSFSALDFIPHCLATALLPCGTGMLLVTLTRQKSAIDWTLWQEKTKELAQLVDEL